MIMAIKVSQTATNPFNYKIVHMTFNFHHNTLPLNSVPGTITRVEQRIAFFPTDNWISKPKIKVVYPCDKRRWVSVTTLNWLRFILIIWAGVVMPQNYTNTKSSCSKSILETIVTWHFSTEGFDAPYFLAVRYEASMSPCAEQIVWAATIRSFPWNKCENHLYQTCMLTTFPHCYFILEFPEKNWIKIVYTIRDWMPE